MEYEEVIETLEHLRSLIEAGADDSIYNENDREIIQRLHRAEFGSGVRECGCKNRFTDAVILLYQRISKRKTMNNKNKYQLRAGVLIWLGTNCYSRANLTDKVAEKWLKLHPDGKDNFDRLPDDEKEKVDNPATE